MRIAFAIVAAWLAFGSLSAIAVGSGVAAADAALFGAVERATH